ncbi:MAG: glycosyltransferase family 4 protein [Methanocellales archaeon]
MEIVMFSPEYWWDSKKGMVLNGKIEDIEKWGGMGRVVAEVSERLPKFGNIVTILARKKGIDSPIYPKSYYSPENIVHYRPVEGVDLYAIPPCSGLGERIQPRSGSLYIDQPIDCIVTWDQIFTALNYIYDYNRDLYQKLCDENTIIHGHDFYGAQFIYNLKTARALPDLKCILSIHMSSDREEEEIKKDERLQWEQKGCKLADKVHVVSKSQERIIKTKYKVRSSKLIYIPNGIDLNKFRPPTEEERRSDTEVLEKYGLKRSYIAFWGRIDPAKGISNLITAYDKLCYKSKVEYDLAIFGMPSNWEYYNYIIRKHSELPKEIKPRVKIYAQQFSEAELLPLIRSASIGVFPSLKEAFGLVALEAQACGLPVVVGNVGGLPENIVDKKTGVLVESSDTSSIADGLEYVIANRAQMAENAILFAQNFSWDKIVEKYVNELYSI